MMTACPKCGWRSPMSLVIHIPAKLPREVMDGVVVNFGCGECGEPLEVRMQAPEPAPERPTLRLVPLDEPA